MGRVTVTVATDAGVEGEIVVEFVDPPTLSRGMRMHPKVNSIDRADLFAREFMHILRKHISEEFMKEAQAMRIEVSES